MVKRIEKQPDISDATVKGAAPAPTGAADVVAGLDAILGEIAGEKQAGEATAAAQEQKAERVEVDTLQQDVAEVLDFLATLAEMLMWWLQPDQFKALWGPAKRKEMAAPLAAIARRHGLDVKGVVGNYGPYAALALALAPSVVVTAKVYKQAKAYQVEQAAAQPTGGADGSSKAG
jgi:hypothetical protein